MVGTRGNVFICGSLLWKWEGRGNVTYTVAIQQLPVGKLEQGHNDKLLEGY